MNTSTLLVDSVFEGTSSLLGNLIPFLPLAIGLGLLLIGLQWFWRSFNGIKKLLYILDFFPEFATKFYSSSSTTGIFISEFDNFILIAVSLFFASFIIRFMIKLFIWGFQYIESKLHFNTHHNVSIDERMSQDPYFASMVLWENRTGKKHPAHDSYQNTWQP